MDLTAYRKTYDGKISSKFMEHAKLRPVNNLVLNNYALNYGIEVLYAAEKSQAKYYLDFNTPELRDKYLKESEDQIHITFNPVSWTYSQHTLDIGLGALTLTKHMQKVINTLCKKERCDYLELRIRHAFDHMDVSDLRNIVNDANFIIPFQKRKPELWALTLEYPSKFIKQGYSPIEIWKELCK